MKKFYAGIFLLLSSIITNQAIAQYCNPSYFNGCSSGDYINRFYTTGGTTNITNNNTGCNGAFPANLTYYSAMNVSGMPGSSFNVFMQSGSWDQGYRIWIDWNNNNSFADAGESVYASTGSSTALVSGTVTIPALATAGTKRMRVMCTYGYTPAATDYCSTNLAYGEVEEYNVIVMTPPACNTVSTGWPSSATTTVDKNNFCVLDSVNFTMNPNIAFQSATGLSFRWSSGPTATGPWTVQTTTTGPTWKAMPLASAYYKAELLCQSTVLTNATPVQVIVNAPTPPHSVRDSFNCGNGSVTLKADASSGYSLLWFDQQVGGSVVGTGSTFNTQPLSNSDTFYVASATTSNVSIQIGTATTSTSNYDAGPFNIWFESSTMQIMYTAAEILAAGGPMNQINNIQLKCTGLPQYALPGFTIKMKTVPASTTNLTWQPANSFTTVYQSPSMMPTMGWNNYTLSTPFPLSSAENLIVSICWAAVPNYSSTGSYEYTSTSGKYLIDYADGVNTCTYTAGYASTYRPNMKFDGLGYCASVRTPVVANIYKPVANITTTNIQPICTGDSLLLSANSVNGYSYQWLRNNLPIPGANNSTYYASQTGTYKVVAMQGNGACRDTSSGKSITVYLMPAPAISYVGSLIFCEGGSVILRAITGDGLSYQWYRNGVPIGGATDSFFEVKTLGNYAVKLSSPQGCNLTSPMVPVTVHPNPTPPIVRNGLVLSTSVYNSYQWFKNNAPIPGANNQNYTATQTGAYLVEVTTPNGCINRSELEVITSLSVKNISSNADVKVYPNPTQSKLNVEASQKVNLVLINALGQTLANVKNTDEIDLSAFASGTYTLLVLNSQNELLSKEKVVKKD